MMTEIFTNYDPIWEFWWDGANGEGPNGKRQEYDWNLFRATVKKLSPETVVFSDVGAYVMSLGTMGGPFQGAAMNPARAFGPDVARGDLSTWWVYVVGPLAGAMLAVAVATILRGPAKAQEAQAAMGTPLGDC